MVDGLIRLMESETEALEPINLGNPEERSVNELLDAVLEIVGRDVEVSYLPLPMDDPRRRKPDIARATALLDWQPQMSLVKGLARTCAWFAEEICNDNPASSGAVSVAAE